MKKVLIDTNIYSLAMKGESTIVDTLRQIDVIGISTISIGELYLGFSNGSRESDNKTELAYSWIHPGLLSIQLMW